LDCIKDRKVLILDKMNIKIENKVRKIIPLIFLTILILAFLHSELGFFNCNSVEHSEHEYCQIIKNTTNQTNRTIDEQVMKKVVEKTICFHCLEEFKPKEKINLFALKSKYFTLRNSTALHLLNNIFLI
jgi:hypothetical protein